MVVTRRLMGGCPPPTRELVKKRRRRLAPVKSTDIPSLSREDLLGACRSLFWGQALYDSVVSMIEEEDFSAYTTCYVLEIAKIASGLCKTALGQETAEMIELCDRAGIYRKFFQYDSLYIPVGAFKYLEVFCRSQTHGELIMELGTRQLRADCAELNKKHSYDQDRKDMSTLDRLIVQPLKQEKDVRMLSREQLHEVNDEFSKMISAIRDAQGHDLTRNVDLLLTAMWKLAYGLFTEDSEPTGEPDTQILEHRKQALIDRAYKQGFAKLYYSQFDHLRLDGYATLVYRFCSTAHTFEEFKQSLSSLKTQEEIHGLGGKKRKLSDNVDVEKNEQNGKRSRKVDNAAEGHTTEITDSFARTTSMLCSDDGSVTCGTDDVPGLDNLNGEAPNDRASLDNFNGVVETNGITDASELNGEADASDGEAPNDRASLDNSNGVEETRGEAGASDGEPNDTLDWEELGRLGPKEAAFAKTLCFHIMVGLCHELTKACASMAVNLDSQGPLTTIFETLSRLVRKRDGEFSPEFLDHLQRHAKDGQQRSLEDLMSDLTLAIQHVALLKSCSSLPDEVVLALGTIWDELKRLMQKDSIRIKRRII